MEQMITFGDLGKVIHRHLLHADGARRAAHGGCEGDLHMIIEDGLDGEVFS